MTSTSLTTATNSSGVTVLTGTASGIDTESIVNSLMTIASAQKTALQTKLTAQQSAVSTYQSLNSALATLATNASGAATGGSIAMTATSSDSSISVTASSTAAASTLNLQVTSLAARHTVLGPAESTWSDASGKITITKADGTSTTLTAASTSLSDVASAVNGANLGVSATRVAAGTDASGATLYRLEFTASKTGAANAFTVSAGTGGGVTLDQEAGGAIVTQGADAQVTLWPGTSSSQTVSSSTNTFGSLLDGVSVTVSKTTSSAATIDVDSSASGTASNVSSLVSSVASIVSAISSGQATSQSTSSGSTTTTMGVFSGDSAVTSVKRAIVAAVQDPVNGVSPSSIGISVGSDGSVSFDSTKFQSAMSADPQGTMAMYQAIATRVNTAATAASDPKSGSLTAAITSKQQNVTTLNTEIDDWTTRLTAKQEAMEAQFAAMEAALSKLQSTQSYLTAQMDSISAQAKS